MDRNEEVMAGRCCPAGSSKTPNKGGRLETLGRQLDDKADAIVCCDSKAGQSVLIPWNAGRASVFQCHQKTSHNPDKLNKPEGFSLGSRPKTAFR